jgi:serine/threonine-protein kinase
MATPPNASPLAPSTPNAGPNPVPASRLNGDQARPHGSAANGHASRPSESPRVVAPAGPVERTSASRGAASSAKGPALRGEADNGATIHGASEPAQAPGAAPLLYGSANEYAAALRGSARSNATQAQGNSPPAAQHQDVRGAASAAASGGDARSAAASVPPTSGELSSLPAADVNESAEPGYLSLDTAPWSEVFLGQTLLGTTPIIKVPLPPGRHLLTLRNSELATSTSYVVEIKSGKTVSRLIGWAQ